MIQQRSTKGASKARRDMINSAICSLRDLLPLPESARQRLSQLQIMSLACCYIRKSNYLTRWLGAQGNVDDIPFEFSQSMTGFMLIMTREGKLLYISENVTEYLGHSMVDMMTQGDCIYDIVDKKDHHTVQTELLQNSFAGGSLSTNQRSFFCRMNVSRAFRRQSGIGDHKVMHVKGHFVQPSGEQFGGQTVFMAMCTPLITPDLKETIIQNHTMVYQSAHTLDMKYIEMAQNGEFHLGYNETNVTGKSWYEFIHPEDIHEAKDKHMQLIKSSHEMGCMLTIRMMTAFGQWVWVNIVMHVRQPYVSENADPAIICINQIIDEEDAQQYRQQSQLYSSHIARSPEYLPHGGNSPVAIQQITMEQEQMFSYRESLETTIYGEFDVRVAPAPPTTTSSPESYQGENPVTTYTHLTRDPFCDNSTKRGLKAQILNKLKRKMAECEGNQQPCRPIKRQRYMPDFVNDTNGGLVVRSVRAEYDGNFMSFGSSQNGGVSVMNPVIHGSGPNLVSLKSKVADIPNLERLPTMVLASSLESCGLPPTPLTPDSVKEPETSTSLSVDTMQTATIPPCIPTPEASPVATVHHEYEAGSPAQAVTSEPSVLTGELEESMFPEVEVKPPKPIVKKQKPLPVLDFGSVTDYFTNLETKSPETKVVPKIEPPSTTLSCANGNNCLSTQVPSHMTSQAPSHVTQNSSSIQMSYEQLDSLIHQVTETVLECVSPPAHNTAPPPYHVTRTPSPCSVPAPVAEVTADFMVVPQQPCMTESAPEMSLDYDLLAGIAMETQPAIPMETQSNLMEELYQLNCNLPSNGNGDQTNPAC